MTMHKSFMKPVLVFLTLLLAAGLSIQCGSSSDLTGVAINKIRLEGDHAEDLNADLEKALAAAGATLNQSGQPDLTGTITWEWAGDKDSPYPTRVRVFVQSEPKEENLTLTAMYEVAKGAQLQNVAHYRRTIVGSVVARLAAQNQSLE